MRYQNPIRRGMYPDPSIVRVQEYFYLANSTFEYYPGIAISRSKDLVNWESLESVAKKPCQADLRTSKSNEGIFAVCIRYHENHFYVVTTNFAEFKTFIIRGTLTADNKIDWEETRAEVNVMGIDPDLYFEDGRTYLQFTGYIDDKGTKALQQVEIKLETGEILRGPEIISYGTGGRDVEGPHIIKKNGFYYLLAAEGGTGAGHMITIFRSENLWGPYKDEDGVNPLFTNRDRAEEPLQNIGHADLFTDVNGNWWMSCLGTHPAHVGFSLITNIGRETLVYPVIWDSDWPKIYHGVPTEEVDLADFPEHAKIVTEQKKQVFEENFEGNKLSNDWLTLRDGLGEDLTVSDGKMTINGRNKELSELGTPSFIGLRQAEHNEEFTVKVSNESEIGDGFFALAVVINIDHFAEITVSNSQGGGYDIHRRQKIADVEINNLIGHLDEMPIELKLVNSGEKKNFSASDSKNTVSFEMDAINLSNEALAALNTGDIEGVHVYGNAKLVVTKVTRA